MTTRFILSYILVSFCLALPAYGVADVKAAIERSHAASTCGALRAPGSRPSYSLRGSYLDEYEQPVLVQADQNAISLWPVPIELFGQGSNSNQLQLTRTFYAEEVGNVTECRYHPNQFLSCLIRDALTTSYSYYRLQLEGDSLIPMSPSALNGLARAVVYDEANKVLWAATYHRVHCSEGSCAVELEAFPLEDDLEGNHLQYSIPGHRILGAFSLRDRIVLSVEHFSEELGFTGKLCTFSINTTSTFSCKDIGSVYVYGIGYREQDAHVNPLWGERDEGPGPAVYGTLALTDTVAVLGHGHEPEKSVHVLRVFGLCSDRRHQDAKTNDER